MDVWYCNSSIFFCFILIFPKGPCELRQCKEWGVKQRCKTSDSSSGVAIALMTFILAGCATYGGSEDYRQLAACEFVKIGDDTEDLLALLDSEAISYSEYDRGIAERSWEPEGKTLQPEHDHYKVVIDRYKNFFLGEAGYTVYLIASDQGRIDDYSCKRFEAPINL